MGGLGPPPTTFRVRFQFLVSNRWEVGEPRYEFELLGRRASFQALDAKTLNDAGEIALWVGGFPTEAEAREFGERLQRAATLAAVIVDQGIDIGGNNAIGMNLSPIFREDLLYQTGIDFRPAVHGVDVLHEGILASPMLGQPATLSVRQPPQPFLESLARSYIAWQQPISQRLQLALQLRAEANLAGEPLALAILAIASVEALTPDEFWSPAQQALLRSMEEHARAATGVTPEEIEEVVRRIVTERRLSVRQGFRRLLTRLGLMELWRRWDDLYGIRSEILHGAAHPDDAHSIVEEARNLSKRIVLTAAAREIEGLAMGANER